MEVLQFTLMQLHVGALHEGCAKFSQPLVKIGLLALGFAIEPCLSIAFDEGLALGVEVGRAPVHVAELLSQLQIIPTPPLILPAAISSVGVMLQDIGPTKGASVEPCAGGDPAHMHRACDPDSALMGHALVALSAAAAVDVPLSVGLGEGVYHRLKAAVFSYSTGVVDGAAGTADIAATTSPSGALGIGIGASGIDGSGGDASNRSGGTYRHIRCGASTTGY